MKVHRGCGRAVTERSREPALVYVCPVHGPLEWYDVTHAEEEEPGTQPPLNLQRTERTP